MIWYRKVVPLLALGLVVACGEPPAEEAPEASADTDQEAIIALGEYWQTHFNMHHADMVASKYADSAWVSPADGGWIEGRDGVEAWLTELGESSPTAEISPVETLVMGDEAMGIGSYSISTTGPDGNPMEMSGSYLNKMEKVDGEWVLAASMTNYDAARPEGWEWNGMPEGDTPPDIDNEFTTVIRAFEAAYNSGDAAGVAQLYADDALVTYSDGPILRGPAAVESAMAQRMEASGDATLVIHQVGTDELDDAHMGSGGWYEIQGPDGTAVRRGMWWNLMEMQPDGSPKILWTLTNGWPAGA